MAEKIEVIETETTFEVGLKDKFIIGAICLVAGLAVEALIEKGYYTVKARRQINKTAAAQQ